MHVCAGVGGVRFTHPRQLLGAPGGSSFRHIHQSTLGTSCNKKKKINRTLIRNSYHEISFYIVLKKLG